VCSQHQARSTGAENMVSRKVEKELGLQRQWRTTQQDRRTLSATQQAKCGAYDGASSCPCRQRRPCAAGPALPGSSCAASLSSMSSAGPADSSLLLPRCLRTAPLLCAGPPAGVLGSAALSSVSTSSQGGVGLGLGGTSNTCPRAIERSDKASDSRASCSICWIAAWCNACMLPCAGGIPASLSAVAANPRSCTRCRASGINRWRISCSHASVLVLCPMDLARVGGGARRR
jgi:hypothetical protein